jgi:hypothetical protein
MVSGIDGRIADPPKIAAMRVLFGKSDLKKLAKEAG